MPPEIAVPGQPRCSEADCNYFKIFAKDKQKLIKTLHWRLGWFYKIKKKLILHQKEWCFDVRFSPFLSGAFFSSKAKKKKDKGRINTLSHTLEIKSSFINSVKEFYFFPSTLFNENTTQEVQVNWRQLFLRAKQTTLYTHTSYSYPHPNWVVLKILCI